MTKAFVPLESNPEVFTQLAQAYGLPSSYEFVDVYSIDDPDLLSFVPRPVEAVILVFPITEVYEKHRIAEDATLASSSTDPNNNVVWFKQTIKNGCGTYAILHSLSNGISLSPGSLVEKLVKDTRDISKEEAAKVLENSDELEKAHHNFASQGSTEAPDADDDSIDLHYVAFTRNGNQLWELDGRRAGPIFRGNLSNDEDLLGETTLNQLRQFFEREKANPSFSILALTNSLA